MCSEKFEVSGLDNQRTAYEVEQYLLGIPHVQSVDADFIHDTVEIEYNEHEIDHSRVLEAIENSGCTIGNDQSILSSIRDILS